MGLAGRGAMVMLLAAACGPAVVLDDGTEGDTEGGESTATGPRDPSATTTSGPSADTTTIEPGDTTAVDESTTSTGTTGDPSDPCPPPIRGLTYLWCGGVSDRANPTTDGSWVYFGAEDGELWRVPAAGGEAERLAEGLGDLFDLEVVDGVAYWTAFFDGIVGSVAVSGGPLQILADDLVKPSSVAVGGGYAFVTQYDADLPVMRYDLASGVATPLYPGHDYAGDAFVLDDALYFANSTNDGNDATPLLRGSFDGAPLQTVMDAEGLFVDIDREGQTLWWGRYRVDDSAILRTALGEPAVTTNLYATPAHPLSLALTPDRVYWTEIEIFDDGQESRLRSVTREGGEPLLHLTNNAALGGVVATDAGVVFLLPGAVARL